MREHRNLIVWVSFIEIVFISTGSFFYITSQSEQEASWILQFVFSQYLIINILGLLLAYYFLRSVNRSLELSKYRLWGMPKTKLKQGQVVLYYFLLRLTFFCIIFSSALPFRGEKEMDTNLRNTELIICLDLSRSMNVMDMGNSTRLEVAKRVLKGMNNELNGEKVGLCIFAGSAIRHIESTRDYKYIETIINSLSTDLIQDQGTNILKALLTAEEMFTSKNSTKGIIVITDAENHNTISLDILRELKEKSIGTIFMGLGTEEGSFVPEKIGGDFIRDENGEKVISKLNIAYIQDLAQKTEGSSIIFSSEFPDIASLLTEINLIKNKKLGTLKVKGNRLLHLWFIWTALISFLLLNTLSFYIKKDEI